MNCYTVKEVADIFKVSTRQVYSLVATGKLKTFRVGGAVRINQSEVDRIMKGE